MSELGIETAAPIMAIAFLRRLTGSCVHVDGARAAHRIAARRCA